MHLNTFYLWLYGIGHMVKDHSIASSHRQDNIYWLEREIAQWDISNRITIINVNH